MTTISNIYQSAINSHSLTTDTPLRVPDASAPLDKTVREQLAQQLLAASPKDPTILMELLTDIMRQHAIPLSFKNKLEILAVSRKQQLTQIMQQQGIPISDENEKKIMEDYEDLVKQGLLTEENKQVLDTIIASQLRVVGIQGMSNTLMIDMLNNNSWREDIEI